MLRWLVQEAQLVLAEIGAERFPRSACARLVKTESRRTFRAPRLRMGWVCHRPLLLTL